ncbi:MAG: Gfo/Idh/MocA family oxidoreductase [Candidatus Hydrogenedentes bacterium]|nr:Gfo/Idh/MocA family oxidoreductase [Candidatus Hydrogenedentota bacterium]
MKKEITRRQFVGSSLALGAGFLLPTIIPGSVWGQQGNTSPNNLISIACIGVGGMGMDNMSKFLTLPDCRVVAVCDAYEDRRKKAKEVVDAKYGDSGCAMYADFREVLARPDIDAVMIAAQDHWHAIMATEAAKAGKDLYCEKPLGVSIEQSRAIVDAVRKHERVLQTGTWQRSLDRFQRACALVRNGYLGKVHTVEVAASGPSYVPKYKGSLDPQPVPEGFDWEMWRGPAPAEPYNPGRVDWPDWYLIFDYCTGFISNWGVHHLDIANWGCPQIATTPFELECDETFRNEGFTNNSNGWNATFTYADDFKMIFKDKEQMKAGARFISDEGWIYIDRSGLWSEPASLINTKFKDSDDLLTDSINHGGNFLECIRSRKDPVSNVDSAHQASCLGMLADIAGRLETKLSWDPATESFKNNDEANAMLHREMHNGWSI